MKQLTLPKYPGWEGKAEFSGEVGFLGMLELHSANHNPGLSCMPFKR
jgi:hypothetical protein